MVTEIRPDAKKTRHLTTAPKLIHLHGKGRIRQAVAVIGKEDFFVAQIFFSSLEALSDVGRDAGVGQRLKAAEKYLGDEEVFLANYRDRKSTRLNSSHP